MKFVEINREQLIAMRQERKKNNEEVKKKLESFLDSDMHCAEVIDDEKYYNNANDLCRSLNNRINRYNMQLNAFMLNGRVYVKRK